jgi:hypothetical protein
MPMEPIWPSWSRYGCTWDQAPQCPRCGSRNVRNLHDVETRGLKGESSLCGECGCVYRDPNVAFARSDFSLDVSPDGQVDDHPAPFHRIMERVFEVFERIDWRLWRRAPSRR